jgi:hypothetical protein
MPAGLAGLYIYNPFDANSVPQNIPTLDKLLPADALIYAIFSYNIPPAPPTTRCPHVNYAAVVIPPEHPRTKLDYS